MLSNLSPGEKSLLFRLKYRDPSPKAVQDDKVMQVTTFFFSRVKV